MTQSVSIAKYKSIRASIERDIRSGRYVSAQRLPTEKEMAEAFGVSYMTARRAVTELVEADLLERRPGAGIFVRSLSSAKLTMQRVSVICRSDDTGSLSRRFQNLATKECESCGWRPHVVHYQNDYYRSAERALLDAIDPAIALVSEHDLYGPLGNALRKAADRAVLVGSRLDEDGVASVMADDALGMHMAMDYLKSAGHEQIALVACKSPHLREHCEFVIWKSYFPDIAESELFDRLIVITPPAFESVSDAAYYAVSNRLKRDALPDSPERITALVVMAEDMVHAVMTACRHAAQPVPQQVSLVCHGGGSEMAYAHPPVTSVDANLEQHLKAATGMLAGLIAGTLPSSDRFRLISPRLVERESVLRLTTGVYTNGK